MKFNAPAIALALILPLLLAGCSITDATRRPQFGWFVPGRVYVVKKEIYLDLNKERDWWGHRSGILYTQRSHGGSLPLEIVTAGTRISLKAITRSATVFSPPYNQYQAVIIDGPYKDTFIDMYYLLRFAPQEYPGESPPPASGVDPDFLAEAQTREAVREVLGDEPS